MANDNSTATILEIQSIFMCHNRAMFLGHYNIPDYRHESGISIVDIFNIFEAIFTILAILAGLWWFLRRRINAPRANIKHKVNFIDLKNKTTYVGVHVTIKNTGDVVITPRITSGNNTSLVIIEELLPYIAKKLESQELSPEYKMLNLGSRTFPPEICIEPREEQSILFEFVIQNTTKAVKVYSHLDNGYNSEKGWDKTTTHEVKYE
jgi:hypothetical protein